VAGTPILRIPVDDGAFKRFLDTFNKYQAQVKAQPEAWKGSTEAITSAVAAGAAFAAEIAHQAEETRRLAQEETARDKAMSDAARRRRQEDMEAKKREEEAAERRKKTIDQARDFGRTVTDLAIGLGKWTVLGGATGLIGSAMGLFGLGSMLAGVGNDRRAAMGMGVSMSQRQGMGVQMQRYFDVNSTLENVANAQADPTKWGAFQMMGVNPNGETAETTRQLAIAARRMFKADKGNLALAGAQGLTQFFSPDDLRRMAGESNGQFNQSISESRRYQGLNDEVGRKWQNFMVTLDTVKLKFENTLIKGLTHLEDSGALDRIVTSFGNLANDVLNRIDWKAFGDGADSFAKYLGSPKFQKDFKEIIDDVGMFAHKMASALRFLGLIPDKNDPGPLENRAPDGTPIGSGNFKGATVGTNKYDAMAVQWAGSQLQKAGWTANQTRGIIANVEAESGFNPFISGDNGKAYGLSQWHADRQAQYAKLYGHTMQSVKDPTQALREQLGFIHWELNHTEKRAGDDLKRTMSAYAAGSTVSREYERPKSRLEDARRGVNAAVTVNIKNQTGASVATTANSVAGG